MCDGSSEYAKMFKLNLNSVGDRDRDLKLRRDGIWVVSDTPHLGKKFHNNFLNHLVKESMTPFSGNIQRVSVEAGVRVQDVRLTLNYMKNVNELFQIMNCKEPITWTSEDDGTGTPIGLRDKLDTCHGLTLNSFSKR